MREERPRSGCRPLRFPSPRDSPQVHDRNLEAMDGEDLGQQVTHPALFWGSDNSIPEWRAPGRNCPHSRGSPKRANERPQGALERPGVTHLVPLGPHLPEPWSLHLPGGRPRGRFTGLTQSTGPWQAPSVACAVVITPAARTPEGQA